MQKFKTPFNSYSPRQTKWKVIRNFSVTQQQVDILRNWDVESVYYYYDLAHRLNIKYHLLMLLENLPNSCHFCGLLTKLLISRTTLFVEFSVNIRCRYDIDTASIWSHEIILKSYRGHVSTSITVIICKTVVLTVFLYVWEVTILNPSLILCP